MVHDLDMDNRSILVSGECYPVHLGLKVRSSLCSTPTLLDDELHFDLRAGLCTCRTSAQRHSDMPCTLEAREAVMSQVDVILHRWWVRLGGLCPRLRIHGPVLNMGPKGSCLLALTCPLPQALPKPLREGRGNEGTARGPHGRHPRDSRRDWCTRIAERQLQRCTTLPRRILGHDPLNRRPRQRGLQPRVLEEHYICQSD
mmetsp:Transcript_113251/g.293115  ORF Transcript_113251/g.293115 Transcript_113251/m.293115 type:complete len:200 (+) Transcript_113251:2422-3021(+)